MSNFLYNQDNNPLFIDEVYIEADVNGSTAHKTRFTSANLLSFIVQGSDYEDAVEAASLTTTTGLKWCVQITNCSGADYVPNTQGAIRLNLCTNFLYANNTTRKSVDQTFTVTGDTAIPNNGSLFFGWPVNTGENTTAVTPMAGDITFPVAYDRTPQTKVTTANTQLVYLADQANDTLTPRQRVATRFRLYFFDPDDGDERVEIDRCGPDFTGGSWQSHSIPIQISAGHTAERLTGTNAVTGANSVKTGCYKRNSHTADSGDTGNSTCPNLSFKTPDWNIINIDDIGSAAGTYVSGELPNRLEYTSKVHDDA